MRTEIQIFQNVEFGTIRTMSNEQGEVMFCAKDVCEALSHSNSRKAIADLVDKVDLKTMVLHKIADLVEKLNSFNHSVVY